MQDARDDLAGAQAQLEAAAGAGAGGDPVSVAQAREAREKAAAYLEETQTQQEVGLAGNSMSLFCLHCQVSVLVAKACRRWDELSVVGSAHRGEVVLDCRMKAGCKWGIRQDLSEYQSQYFSPRVMLRQLEQQVML